jgi:hypothetical protein
MIRITEGTRVRRSEGVLRTTEADSSNGDRVIKVKTQSRVQQKAKTILVIQKTQRAIF